MSKPCNSPSRGEGQVMPMTLIFIVAVLLSLWIMYDAGSVMADKIRLQNTADNVAYSSAALVSRDLNFVAYTNRGMVANQVSIAQMVGLSSWAASMEQLAANADTIASVFPPARAFTGAFRTGATSASDSVDQFADGMIRFSNLWILNLSRAQRLFHLSVIGQLPGMASDIAALNDPDAFSLISGSDASFIEAASALQQWNQNIGEQYRLRRASSAAENDQFENSRYRDFESVIKDSSDPFTLHRSYKWDLPFSTPKFPGGWETRKYGGNEFFRFNDPQDDTYRWDWTAMETVAFRFIICDLDGCDAKDPGIPLTWGASHALDADKASDFSDYGVSSERRDTSLWGHGTWRNDLAAYALLASPATSVITGGKDHVNHRIGDTQALQAFYEFRSDGVIDAGPALVALYAKRERDIHSQQNILSADGSVVAGDMDARRLGGLAQGRIGAIAKAQPYFARPTDLAGWTRGDNRLEHGNLYNPYWQPRLIEVSNEEKAASVALVGGVVIDAQAGASK